MPRRRGRPGIAGTMARTAVIAGTATAVSGGMQRKSANKQAAQQNQAAANQAAYESQDQLDEMQAQMNAMQTQQAPAPQPAVATVPAADDIMGQLQRLADMKNAGLLTDAEFAAAKAKLLS
ncbi:MAG: SHOCT domain-containing protein [Acidimicrobiia bacterium]